MWLKLLKCQPANYWMKILELGYNSWGKTFLWLKSVSERLISILSYFVLLEYFEVGFGFRRIYSEWLKLDGARFWIRSYPSDPLRCFDRLSNRGIRQAQQPRNSTSSATEEGELERDTRTVMFKYVKASHFLTILPHKLVILTKEGSHLRLNLGTSYQNISWKKSLRSNIRWQILLLACGKYLLIFEN